MQQPVTQAVLLTVAYVGTDFHGFALQKNARSVAGDLLAAVRILDPSVRSLRVVSRTDTGVHARGQLVAFNTQRSISPRGWVLGLANHLPETVTPRTARIVAAGFDPRGYVKHKWYRYTLLRDCRRDAFYDATSWRIGYPLDLSLARSEAAMLVGKHDFAAFRSVKDDRASTVRTIHEVTISEPSMDQRLVYIDVHGDGFLHNMVRIIVGTLVDVARGQLAPAAVERGIESHNRGDLGITAPAKGLCLERVTLEADFDSAPVWPAHGDSVPEGAKRS